MQNEIYVFLLCFFFVIIKIKKIRDA